MKIAGVPKMAEIDQKTSKMVDEGVKIGKNWSKFFLRPQIS